ncbi:MAG: class I SAM-dependent methyltransferase [Clostridia bacterium]|nr:class I SAM-dependent methyltransferase [Clostridia bacterium]
MPFRADEHKTIVKGEIQLKDLFNLLINLGDKKFILFGTGNLSKQLCESIDEKIAYFVDNDPSKWNTTFLGRQILEPGILSREKMDNYVILIASTFFKEISRQLETLGFKEKVHYWNGMELFKDFNNGSGSLQTINVDYPINPLYRYGYDKPPHPQLYDILNRNISTYKGCLQAFLQFKKLLLGIAVSNDGSKMDTSIEPIWNNSTMSGLDAAAIYCFIVFNKPKRYLEIGSGNSTKFARRAIKDNNLETQIISIDPHPRTEIDQICNKIYRKPLEDTNLDIFDELTAGDILFIDNSHRCFTNSDVTVVFLDILPRLNKGVFVQFHDIFLPYDYPPEWKNRFYSEQYLLASYILAEGNKFEILLPNSFVSGNTELMKIIEPLWEDENMKNIQRGGASFWIRIT